MAVDPVHLEIALSGSMAARYRNPDGSWLVQLDPMDLIRTPLGRTVPGGAYALYVEVGDDGKPAGTRRIEVGLGDAIAQIEYEAPFRGWIGPIRLDSHDSGDALEWHGNSAIRMHHLWLVPAAHPRPADARDALPNRRSPTATVWLDLPSRELTLAWYPPGEVVRVRVRTAWSGGSTRARATCTVLDFHHEAVATTEFEIQLDRDGARATLQPIRVPTAFGPYLVRCTVGIAGAPRSEFQLSLARVRDGTAENEQLGLHGNAVLGRRMGAPWNRLWDSGGTRLLWRTVEPERGIFKFDDGAPSSARTLAVLDVPPSWAGSIERSRGEWLEYARQVARREHSRISAWEIFNEPYHAVDDSWSTEHAALVAETAVAIHQVDRDAVVLSGGPPEDAPPGLVWWESLGRAGMFRAVDGLSVHMYFGRGGSDPLDSDVRFHAYALALRAVVDRYGGLGKPIWDTESGIGPNESFYIGRRSVYGSWEGETFLPRPPVPYVIGAAMSSRLLLEHAWFAMPWFIYQGDAAYGNSWSLVDFDGSPLPLAVAISETSQLLRGARGDGVPTLPDGLRGLRFRRGAEEVVALWAVGSGAHHTITVVPDHHVQLLDMFGNHRSMQPTISVDLEPMFFVGDAPAVAAVLATVR